MIEYLSMLRRVYTDGRDFPGDGQPSFMGYSIGKWVDTDGAGRYDTLEIETRLLKGPRSYDATGLPLHEDNKTIVKERIFLDKTNPNVMLNEITTIDNALTRPWVVVKRYNRVRQAALSRGDLRGRQPARAHRQGKLHGECRWPPDARQEEPDAAGLAILQTAGEVGARLALASTPWRPAMLYRRTAGAIALSLLLPLAGAQAHDESRYPAFEGKWNRDAGPPRSTRASRRGAGRSRR